MDNSLKCPQIHTVEDPTQTNLICSGIPVVFPYKPYPSQVEYISSVIEACESSKHALLESATGTGKTLSLLCGSLAWLKQKRASCPELNYPKVIYSSRTHAQLAQIVGQLRKTVYRPSMCILASRDHTCINKEARKYSGSQLNITCMRLKKIKKCPYAKGTRENLIKLRGKLLDLEDFRSECKSIGWCPFYAARELIPAADLLLLPYNYILDLMYHSMFRQIQYANSIVIFDEAHNVQSVAEDAWSFDFSIEWLKKCVGEIDAAKMVKESILRGEGKYDNIAAEVKNITMEELDFVKYPIINLMEYLKKVENVGEEGLTFDGKMLIELFIKGTGYSKDSSTVKDGLSLLNSNTYSTILGNCSELLAPLNLGAQITLWFQTISMVFWFMSNEKQAEFSSAFKFLNKVNCNTHDYKLLLHDDCEKDKRKEKNKEKKKEKSEGEFRSLKAFCFNPGFSFMVILEKNPRSIILTSGTLTPMELIERDLRMNFSIKLAQGHIIDDNQVLTQIITHDYDNSKFNFNYENRNNTKQIYSLGKLIKEISINTTGGVLVFFTSYIMLNKYYGIWKADMIPLIQNAGRRVYRENADSQKNAELMKEYKESIKRSLGAVFFAVCRGKVSEGMDFFGSEARTAIVVGVPFPAATCKRVVLKRQYLDEHHEILGVNSQMWYIQEAMRTVNQSLGRIIRNKQDYGALVLIDYRYSNDWLRNKLSFWMAKNLRIVGDSVEAVENLKTFFKQIEDKKLKVPQKHKRSSQYDKVDDLMDLLMMALGNTLFKEIMELFRLYREGKVKSVALVAECVHKSFLEAFKKSSECKRAYLRLALRKTIALVNKEDKDQYRDALIELTETDPLA
eukprot:TRINITY_DN11211_c0_g2_i2.p1 TRINITY_DN11211_c0_g2~~TRINITY_DN11211_c0_g2_i2.p1  ORF type:complete len:850 (+),score=159.30 TRINITY_DN11211_c0_g2_i2:132-2681(+)